MNVRLEIRLFSTVIHFHRISQTGYIGWDPQVFDSTWLINYSIPSVVDWFLDISNKGNARVIIHPFFLVTTCVSETLFILVGFWLDLWFIWPSAHTAFAFVLSDDCPQEGTARITPSPKLYTLMTTNSELNLLERSQLLKESIS